LVKGDLRGIVKAVHLSRKTMSNIRQNLFFAFIYNALGVPVAAGVLYPFFGVLPSPVIASGLAVAGVILTAGFSMFPFVMPSNSYPGSSLTVWDSVSSHRTLLLMFWVTVFFLPLIAMYTS
jgi:cytochrome bd-type quinol oxidase subunit 2